jgi:hypothetical protein
VPLRDYIREHKMELSVWAERTVCITPDSLMHAPLLTLDTPADCAVLFSASTGLTQRSELGILAAMFICLLVVLAVTVHGRVKRTKTCNKPHYFSFPTFEA